MNKFTLEIYLMFIGCVLIILSARDQSVNYFLMIVGLGLTIISTVLFVKKIKGNKGDNNDRKES